MTIPEQIEHNKTKAATYRSLARESVSGWWRDYYNKLAEEYEVNVRELELMDVG